MQCLSPVESEVLNVVLAADIVPNRMDDTQLLQAIQALAGNGVSSISQAMYIEERVPSGTDIAYTSAMQRVDRQINTVASNTIPGASLDSVGHTFTLPADMTFRIRATVPAYRVNSFRSYLVSISGDAIEIMGGNAHASDGSAVGGHSHIDAEFSTIQETVLKVQFRGLDAFSPNGFGSGLTVSGEDNVYTKLMIERVA